jgi:hypothetical protein
MEEALCICFYTVCCALICCSQKPDVEETPRQEVRNPMRENPLKNSGEDKEDGSVQVHRKPVHQV